MMEDETLAGVIKDLDLKKEDLQKEVTRMIIGLRKEVTKEAGLQAVTTRRETVQEDTKDTEREIEASQGRKIGEKALVQGIDKREEKIIPDSREERGARAMRKTKDTQGVIQKIEVEATVVTDPTETDRGVTALRVTKDYQSRTVV